MPSNERLRGRLQRTNYEKSGNVVTYLYVVIGNLHTCTRKNARVFTNEGRTAGGGVFLRLPTLVPAVHGFTTVRTLVPWYTRARLRITKTFVFHGINAFRVKQEYVVVGTGVHKVDI